MALTSRTRSDDCVVPYNEWLWIENTHGLLDPIEGEWLANHAAEVPTERSIVEIGSHTGLSTLWMASGAANGHGAQVYAVDPWPDPGYAPNDDPFEFGSGDAVYQRFMDNIHGLTQQVYNRDYSTWVTPMRMTSVEAAAEWVRWGRHPIGLLFIDAIHTFEGVKADVDLWMKYVPVGGWLAMNDYWVDTDMTQLNGAAFVAKELLEPTGQWTDVEVVWNTWVGRRVGTD